MCVSIYIHPGLIYTRHTSDFYTYQYVFACFVVSSSIKRMKSENCSVPLLISLSFSTNSSLWHLFDVETQQTIICEGKCQRTC